MAEIPEISATAPVDQTRNLRPQTEDQRPVAARIPISPGSGDRPSAEIARTSVAGEAAALSVAPPASDTNGLQVARDRIEISPAAERAFSALNSISQFGPQGRDDPASAEVGRAADARSGQAPGAALRNIVPDQGSRLDDTPREAASVETDPTDGPAPANADPRASNQRASAEIERAGNDGRSQSEASRTLGQVVEVFA